MFDGLASTMVGIVTAFLSRRGSPEAERLRHVDGDAARGLAELVWNRLAEDPALRLLRQEAATTGAASERTKQRVQLALIQALESDPAFAGTAGTLMRQVEGQTTVRADGTSSIDQDQRVRQDRFEAGRDIRTKTVSRSSNEGMNRP